MIQMKTTSATETVELDLEGEVRGQAVLRDRNEQHDHENQPDQAVPPQSVRCHVANRITASTSGADGRGIEPLEAAPASTAGAYDRCGREDISAERALSLPSVRRCDARP